MIKKNLPSLQAFDQHLNMVLGEVEESVMTREVDEETEEEIVRASGAVLALHFVYYLSQITVKILMLFSDFQEEYRYVICARRCRYSCVPPPSNCIGTLSGPDHKPATKCMLYGV